MGSNRHDLLTVLKAELDFVEKGGYRNTARAPWRPHFIFQDSPTCLNFDPTVKQHECAECALMELIPPSEANKKVPCRFIQLNEAGETIDSLYRYGSQEELEAALMGWLKKTIEKLSQQGNHEPKTAADLKAAKGA